MIITGGTILVVDDEAAIREVMRLSLESGGIECLAASDGQEALEILNSYEGVVCGVITDLHMPGMDGPTLIRHLKELRPELPVIVSSGSVSPEDQLALVDLGVAGFLQKPYTAKELLRCVEPIVQGAHCVAG